MRKVFGPGCGRLLLPAVAVMIGTATLVPQRAGAQFFWDQPRLSADDAARVVMDRGFRPLRRPFRNDKVYVADVIDRRGRQERLIVSADSGEIVQRFFIEGRRDASLPPGPVPPATIPNTERRSGLFSRLFGGEDDQPEDRREEPGSQFAPNYALPPPAPAVQPRPRPKRVPRVVERAPETVPAYAPIESAPLAPATAAPPPATATSAPPAPSATVAAPPPDKPAVRAVNKDPLAIPGSREDDEKTAAKPATFAVARPAPKPVPAVAPKPADPKPAEAKSVPVAPLD